VDTLFSLQKLSEYEKRDRNDEEFAPTPYHEGDEDPPVDHSASLDGDDNYSPAVRALMASCVPFPPHLLLQSTSDVPFFALNQHLRQAQIPAGRRGGARCGKGARFCLPARASANVFVRRSTSLRGRTRNSLNLSPSFAKPPSLERPAPASKQASQVSPLLPQRLHPTRLVPFASFLSVLDKRYASTTKFVARAAAATMRWATSVRSFKREEKTGVLIFRR
jgi:hypothetical protein